MKSEIQQIEDIFNIVILRTCFRGLGGLEVSALDFHAGYRGFESR